MGSGAELTLDDRESPPWHYFAQTLPKRHTMLHKRLFVSKQVNFPARPVRLRTLRSLCECSSRTRCRSPSTGSGAEPTLNPTVSDKQSFERRLVKISRLRSNGKHPKSQAKAEPPPNSSYFPIFLDLFCPQPNTLALIPRPITGPNAIGLYRQVSRDLVTLGDTEKYGTKWPFGRPPSAGGRPNGHFVPYFSTHRPG